MQPIRLAIVAACLIATLACAPAAPALDLVRDGQPRAEIVISETPARMTRLAARELQTYITKISGAVLPIITAPSGAAPAVIYVGVSPHTEQLGLRVDDLKYGAFRMASGTNWPARNTKGGSAGEVDKVAGSAAGWLALMGPDGDFVPVEPYAHGPTGGSGGAAERRRIDRAWDTITGDTFSNPFHCVYAYWYDDLNVWAFDDAGTLNAVYEFLRGLGVRWYAPGELGQVVPTRSTIALPQLDRTVRPDFDLRRLSYYWQEEGLGEKAIWNLRLGLNPGHEIIGITQTGHGMKFVTMREEVKQAHPEFYALWDGQRATDHKDAGAPCLSAPGLFVKHLRYVRSVFDHFGEPAISLDVVDGLARGMCECDQCRGRETPERGMKGSLSDYVWEYVDRVAREIYETHPDRMVTGSAYGAYQLPPTTIETMRPNLMVTEARSRSNFHDPEVHSWHRALRKAWLEKLAPGRYSTRDYYLHSRPAEAGRPVYFPRLIAEDLRALKGISVGEHIEVYQHPPHRPDEFHYDEFAIDHLNLYVTARLWWDADQDLDALLEEYYTNYYGPARTQMKPFIEYSETNWMYMGQDPERIGHAFELLDEAVKAVEPASVFDQRIQRVVKFIQPLKNLQEQLGRKRENTPSYRVLLTMHTIKRSMTEKELDGRLSPEFYPAGMRVGQLTALTDGTPAMVATSFQIFREADMLYVGIRCAEPDMADPTSGTAAGREETIAEGDFVTVLIETGTHCYYEIKVTPAGTVFECDHDAKDGGTRWSSGARVAVHYGETSWNVEIALPIAGEGAKAIDPLHGMDGARPSDSYPWYFNVGRQRVRGGKVERWAYSPTGTNEFHVLSRFARLWGK